MTSRLLALMLVCLIGSPVCWCCAQGAVPIKKAARSCCERKREKENPKPPGRRESCPCAGSLVQREATKSTLTVPPAALSAPMVVEFADFSPRMTPAASGRFIMCNDTGPPCERAPLYLRQHALLL